MSPTDVTLRLGPPEPPFFGATQGLGSSGEGKIPQSRGTGAGAAPGGEEGRLGRGGLWVCHQLKRVKGWGGSTFRLRTGMRGWWQHRSWPTKPKVSCDCYRLKRWSSCLGALMPSSLHELPIGLFAPKQLVTCSLSCL